MVAVTAALTAYLRRPARRSSAADQKRQSLITYLRDHLGGADAAIHVVRRLASTHEGTEDGHLFRQLAEEFDQDRAIVQSLVERLGASPRSLKRAAGYASGSVLRTAAGGEPGELSLLRTFEALAIGVQGKRCMWRALQALDTAQPAGHVNFLELELKAVRQWETIEKRRRLLAATTFPALGAVDSRVE